MMREPRSHPCTPPPWGTLSDADLTAGAQATPVTHAGDGKQHLVVAAGGHSKPGTTMGDSLIAFAPP